MGKFSSQYVAINCDNGAFVRLTITGIKMGLSMVIQINT